MRAATRLVLSVGLLTLTVSVAIPAQANCESHHPPSAKTSCMAVADRSDKLEPVRQMIRRFMAWVLSDDLNVPKP